ncbi:hypothetical protein SLA2020_507410 [Shorea laevis]
MSSSSSSSSSSNNNDNNTASSNSENNTASPNSENIAASSNGENNTASPNSESITASPNGENSTASPNSENNTASSNGENNTASPLPIPVESLIDSLMEKLQIGPTSSFSLEKFPSPSSSIDEILAPLENLEEGVDEQGRTADDRHRERLLKEERELEEEVVRLIISGKTESLMVNSGQAVTLRDHYVCVSSRKDRDGEYRIWEWHGHIMLFNERGEFSPEYFYGNYFERLPERTSFDLYYEESGLVVEVEEDEEDDGPPPAQLDLGLRGLISGINCTNSGRIVHRNVNADSQSFL